jgi:alkylhydroperoxidase family enzyme
VSPVGCPRCGEDLRNPGEPCRFCRLDRIEKAVDQLRAAAKSTSNAALLARVEAIDTLRNCGFTSEQVLQARAHALDGHSTARILEVLGAEESEAVAA